MSNNPLQMHTADRAQIQARAMLVRCAITVSDEGIRELDNQLRADVYENMAELLGCRRQDLRTELKKDSQRFRIAFAKVYESSPLFVKQYIEDEMKWWHGKKQASAVVT